MQRPSWRPRVDFKKSLPARIEAPGFLPFRPAAREKSLKVQWQAKWTVGMKPISWRRTFEKFSLRGVMREFNLDSGLGLAFWAACSINPVQSFV